MKLQTHQSHCRISKKYYLLVKIQWAQKMTQWTSGLSKKNLILLLLLFIVIAAFCSGYLIYTGLQFEKKVQ